MEVRLTKDRIRDLQTRGILYGRLEVHGPSSRWARIHRAEDREIAFALQLVAKAIRANG